MRFEDDDDNAIYNKSDISRRGLVIAMRKMNYGYIGDYYVLSSKRS